jgi:hypothetical protein
LADVSAVAGGAAVLSMTTFFPSAFALVWQVLSPSAQFTAFVVARSADDATAFSAERFTRLRTD